MRAQRLPDSGIYQINSAAVVYSSTVFWDPGKDDQVLYRGHGARRNRDGRVSRVCGAQPRSGRDPFQRKIRKRTEIYVSLDVTGDPYSVA